MSSVLSVNKDYFAVVYKRNVCTAAISIACLHSLSLLCSQVKDELYIYDSSGKEIERLAKDFVGSASVTAREKQPFFFVSLTGFTSPGTLGRYDFTEPDKKKWSIFRTTKLNGLNTEDFEASQVCPRDLGPSLLTILVTNTTLGLVQKQGWYINPHVHRPP